MSEALCPLCRINPPSQPIDGAHCIECIAMRQKGSTNVVGKKIPGTRLTPLEYSSPRLTKYHCECGTDCFFPHYQVDRLNNRTCGACNKVGESLGLEVGDIFPGSRLELADTSTSPPLWKCLNCERVVPIAFSQVRRGNNKTCGRDCPGKGTKPSYSVQDMMSEFLRQILRNQVTLLRQIPGDESEGRLSETRCLLAEFSHLFGD